MNKMLAVLLLVHQLHYSRTTVRARTSGRQRFDFVSLACVSAHACASSIFVALRTRFRTNAPFLILRGVMICACGHFPCRTIWFASNTAWYNTARTTGPLRTATGRCTCSTVPEYLPSGDRDANEGYIQQ